MASIEVPTAGAPVLDTWGAQVANRLNAMIPVIMTADQATNVASGSGGEVLTELSWPVVSGRVYIARLSGAYAPNASNQGLQMAVGHPGGGLRAYLSLTGNGSDTGKTEARIVAASSFAGRTSTDTAFTRNWWLDVHYECDTDGAASILFGRGGTSGAPGITIFAGSGGLVLEAS